jgi:hypothetical protein
LLDMVVHRSCPGDRAVAEGRRGRADHMYERSAQCIDLSWGEWNARAVNTTW